MRRFKRDKKCRIIIIPAVEVFFFEMDFGSGIKVNLTLFVSFAKYYALPLLKSISSLFIFTNSPTRIPVDESKSIIAITQLDTAIS